MEVSNTPQNPITNSKENVLNNVENGQIIKQNPSQILSNEIPIDDHIHNKKAFRRFIKLIKEDKFTSAIITARTLGIGRATVYHWLSRPKVQELLEGTIDQYVSKIEKSKDWKAQAYLLDKLTPQDKEAPEIDIQNLILVKRG